MSAITDASVSVRTIGSSNVGIIRRDGKCLLIGCAPPDEVARADVDPTWVEWILLTHHHRNAAEGLRDWAAMGARLAVPEAERRLFEDAEARWRDESHRVHAYNYHPSRRTLRENVPVARGLGPTDAFEWRGLLIDAIPTPGPSSGGVSLIVRDGDRTIAFVGELMCGHGKLRDFWLLQGRRPMPGGELMEYHGFGERALDCVASLETVLERKPDVLVPSFGSAVRRPVQAVAALKARIGAARRNYHAISAGRWYFPAAWPDVPDITADLRKRCRPLPTWVLEVGGTSRCIVADDRAALLMDCAGDAPERIRSLQASGRLGQIEGLWITHYHDDHVDHVNAFIAAQPCPVIVHRTMADLLRRPEAYWMPCLDPRPITPNRITSDGESWQWRGFTVTAYDLPGQTFYDAALLVERGSERVLFVGDSFTPGGLDDYCTLNRNLLGPGLGYDRCLALLDRLGPDVLLVNQHVAGGFVFSRAEVADMRRTLDERRRLFADLLDWDDPNFGLDPQWIRLEPYHCAARPGDRIEWTIIVQNYGVRLKRFRLELRLPDGWRSERDSGVLTVPARSEGRLTVSAIPERETRRRSVVGLAVQMDRRNLGDIAEAIVDITDASPSSLGTHQSPSPLTGEGTGGGE